MDWKVLLSLIVFVALYVVAYLHNDQLSGHPYDKFMEIKIKHFPKLFWFKDKQKGVVKYCYLMQLHCIIASLVFMLIWIGSNIYNCLSDELDISMLAKILIGYIFANILIIVGYIIWGDIDRLINGKKREKKKKSK